MELLYADDLVLMAESEELLVEKIRKWKAGMEDRGLRVNMGKTKVMRCRVDAGQVQKSGSQYRCVKCTGGGNPVKIETQQLLPLGDGQSLECVEKFCYLGDMIGAGGGAEEAA